MVTGSELLYLDVFDSLASGPTVGTRGFSLASSASGSFEAQNLLNMLVGGDHVCDQRS